VAKELFAPERKQATLSSVRHICPDRTIQQTPDLVTSLVPGSLKMHIKRVERTVSSTAFDIDFSFGGPVSGVPV
jgi:hypothetical protein